MTSQKRRRYFDLTKEQDVEEVHRMLFDSDSDASLCDDDEDDVVIPDLRNASSDENAEEETTHPISQDKVQAPVTSSSDSEEDTPSSAQESSGPVKVNIVKAPTKLKGINGYGWSGEKGVLHRAPARNLIVHLPGNKNTARQVTSGLEAWRLCFTKENLDAVTEHTNREIEVQRLKYNRDVSEECDTDDVGNRPSYTRKTDSTEVQALIGILYYAGVMKMGGVFTKELFDANVGIPIFRAAMPEARFRFLVNCLRFDNKETREGRKATDKLAAFRDIFEQSINAMKHLYVPSEYITIDEQLVGFRGRCPFKMYIPSKPDKYGIKIVMCCDAKTFFVLDAEVYTGKGSTPNNVQVALYYCEKLTSCVHGTNRNVTMDNWFTSVDTAKTLLEKKVTVVGTLRKNKREIPPSFLTTKERQMNSAMFCFSGPLTLLSYCPPKSKKKIVLMLSTMHEKGDEPNSVHKPDIIEFYNSTKGGVDTLDQLCHTYSCSRKTRRWPLCLFYNLLNIIGVNSMILLRGSIAKDKETVTNRRDYLKKLAMDLMRPHMERRLAAPTLRRELRETINRILGVSVVEAAPRMPEPTTGRCNFCPRSKDRKSRVKCALCKKFICLEHQQKVCPTCAHS